MLDLSIDSRIFLTTPLEEAVQEIDLLFNTSNCELIGKPDFGTDFEQFLWQSCDASSKIESYIYEKLGYTVYTHQFNVNVSVNMVTGQYRNIYNVVITLSDNDNNIERRSYQLR